MMWGPDHKILAWLEPFAPSNFALVMATGILAIAFDAIGVDRLAQAMAILCIGLWLILMLISALRLMLYAHAVRIDLLNIRRVFAFFTVVVATNIVGLLFNRLGWPGFAMACWAAAFITWSLLLYLSFSVLTFLTHEHSVNVVHGDWLTSIIATQSLVLLGAAIAPQMGGFSGYMMIEIHLLWGLGLIFYGVFVTLFCYRIFFLSFKPEDTSPLLWVVMGAAAVGANAGTSLILANTQMAFFERLRPFVDGVALLLWAWATWWIPMLVIFGVWKHIVRRFPIRYETAQWTMVFPLGMYALTSQRFGLAADFPPLQWISGVMVWVAFAVWCAVFVAMLGTLLRFLTRPPVPERRD